MAESGDIRVVLTPVQLYAILNGRSISAGELAANRWNEMPGPPTAGANLRRFMQPLAPGESAAAIRQYLAENDGTGGSGGRGSSGSNVASRPMYAPARNPAVHYAHPSQPGVPECWIPPTGQRLSSATINRVFAAIEIVGGVGESVGGVLLLLAPEPTMLSKVAGGVMTVHGTDFTQAAIRQLFSGKRVSDLTEQGGTWAARRAGASEQNARRFGVILDVAVGLGDVAAGGAAKIASIRAGRMILSEEAVAGKVGRVSGDVEEADALAGKEGGHTLERHVNVNDDDLLDRALKSRDVSKVFSRFSDQRAAEDAINECIRANRQAIQRWASNPILDPAFEHDLGRTIGRGFFNSNGKFADMTKVRVVFRMSKQGPKSFFIITAYPVP